jgi:hypothetical protein
MRYVSGASDRNVKRPEPSVVVVSTWDGLEAVIFAFATGAFAAVLVTEPEIEPVVPASANDP